LGAGIRAVLAPSFSRTYFRNAVNNGLLPVICDTSSISEGDRLKIQERGSPQTDIVTILDETTGKSVTAAALPKVMLDILTLGGIVPYFRKYHDFMA
jgi:3-isopropylmalate/(R)-2-methylmalate dehydratase small subunit